VIHNGTYTLFNPKSKGHKTLKVWTMPQQSRFAPGSRVVGVLERQRFRKFGFVGPNHITVWKRYRGSSDPAFLSTEEDKLAFILMEMLRSENSTYHRRGMTIRASRTCHKCNRKITDPVSLELGVGPECGGTSWHKRKRMLNQIAACRVAEAVNPKKHGQQCLFNAPS